MPRCHAIDPRYFDQGVQKSSDAQRMFFPDARWKFARLANLRVLRCNRDSDERSLKAKARLRLTRWCNAHRNGVSCFCRQTPIYHCLLTVRFEIVKGPEPQVLKCGNEFCLWAWPTAS